MVRVREFATVASVAFVAMGVLAVSGQHPFRPEKEVVALNAFVARSEMAVAHLIPPPAPAVDEAPPAVTQPVKVIPQGSPVVDLDIQPQPARTPSPAPKLAAKGKSVRPLGVRLAATAAALPKVALRLAETDDTPPVTDETADRANAVALRLRQSVPPELFSYFDVYLYVSKAAHGPWAQHMFIFHKDADDHLAFEQAIPVSTGRERQEKYFTSTPTGMFELDPNRFDRNHRSHLWNNAPMPWAMFLNYTIDDRLEGLALHSAAGHVALLGRRASGGCVRLPPRMARTLFKRFQAEERGLVPRFAFNAAHSTTLTDGTLDREADGQPVMTAGYKVLLIIQDYSGGPALVAELS